MNIAFDNLFLKRDAESRSITAENPRGEKGKGGMATVGNSLHPASALWSRHLGVGWKASPCVTIAAGETCTIMDNDGPGVIRHIFMSVMPRFPHLYRDVVLRMYWDGQADPSIECPLGDFFCVAWGQPLDIPAMAMSVNPNGGLNCYFSMPFRKHARITVTNESPDEIKEFFYGINYTLEPLLDDALHFHAQFRRTNPTLKSIHVLADDIRGQGQYVGTFMAWQQNSPRWWGEGELKMYLDGDTEFPTICGTGTEDYFCGAWGFNRDYAGPFTGYRRASGTAGEPGGRVIMYRFHVHDPVFFKRDIRVTIQALSWREITPGSYEHRAYVPLQDDIASVAYWYQTLPSVPLPPLVSHKERKIQAVLANVNPSNPP